MLSSQSYRYAVLLIILASSHSFSITSYRLCPLKCCYNNNNNNNHYNIHSNNKKVVSLQLLNNDLDKDRKIKTESNQFIPVQTIALVANDKRQYYYSILLFVSLLSCLKLFDNSNNDIISNRIIDSFTYTSSYWRYFVCGAISCSISHVITVPFDVIKTKIQTNSKDNNNNIIISSSSLSTTSDMNSSVDTSSTSTGSNNSMIVMTKRIIADEGISGLFTGVIPTFIGFSIQGALKYGFFEVFKPLVKASIIAYHMNHDHTLLNSDDNDNTVLSLFSLSQLDIISILIVSAASAELIGSFFLTPFEAIRIRQVSATATSSTSPATSSSTTSTDHKQQQQQQQVNQKSDIITFISTIITNEGVSSLFLGLPAIMLKAIPYTAVQLSCFELCSTAFYQTLFDSGSMYDNYSDDIYLCYSHEYLILISI